MVRIILAGIIGGLAMFMWAGFAHSVLPLGHTGVDEIPNEAAVTAALAESLGSADGLYYYPAFGTTGHPSVKEKQEGLAAYKEKLKTTPHGMLVYHPAGGGAENEMRYYIGEASLEVVEALVCAFLLAMTAIAGFAQRVFFVSAIGFVAAITTNGSYWNWWGFPLDYTLAYGFIQLVGFVVAGIVIALIVKKPA